MEYYFNELEPRNFQRLINSILLARFGEDFRTTPLQGANGGRNGETSAFNPYFEFSSSGTSPLKGMEPPRKGKYLFQVKHHKTTDLKLSIARNRVISEFVNEMKKNVLSRKGKDRVNYFFLVTNVPSSRDAIKKLDKRIQRLLSKTKNLHVDVWWKEQITAYMDQIPSIWNSFPEVFSGRAVPILGQIVMESKENLPRATRFAIKCQYNRDSVIKFRQIDLEKSLSRLFVDLHVRITSYTEEQFARFYTGFFEEFRTKSIPVSRKVYQERFEVIFSETDHVSGILSLKILMDESKIGKKIILEGGPGQGKSTITQMLAQIYRENILGRNEISPENRWFPPTKARIPFRIELREYAEFLANNPRTSIEKFLAEKISQDSGGNVVNVDDIQIIFEKSPVLLIFDGLDEIGSDDLRDSALKQIKDCISRFENNGSEHDLRFILTTRPPAIAGRRKNLPNFTNITIEPMSPDKIDEYLERWLKVQVKEKIEKERIRNSFQRRKHEPHVQALARNPMQLSVLLHFIRLKGEAFPDRRAELYRDYFQIVIDRDVEKSQKLREQRQLIEALHQFLGYKIHSLTEAKKADGSLIRENLLELVENWLRIQGETQEAREIFRIGEERLGLIVVLKGEGDNAYHGYEIQPIREYFAAAFINEQIEGDANEIFQKMIRRSFWKEVAIFLAGLRRPNEKADLIARAKALDDDKLGWRMDGRNLVFKLLQEGIFSTPNHIFLEAVNYLIDLLDPRILKNPNENGAILLSLPNLINQNRLKRHIDRIKRLVEEYCTSDDDYKVYRIYEVACKVLELQETRLMLKRFKSKKPDLIARVRLLWPFVWGIDLKNEFYDEDFWDGVPDNIWAKVWMKTATRHPEVMKIDAPSRLHRLIAIEFAFNFEAYQILTEKPVIFQLKIKWAICRLINDQSLLILMIISRGEILKESLLKRDDLLNLFESENYKSLDFTGLDRKYHDVIKFCIELTRRTIKSLMIGNNEEATKLILDQKSTINKYLEEPGLPSALCARCLKNILFVVSNLIHLERLENSESSILIDEEFNFEDIIIENNELRLIWEKSIEFFKSLSTRDYPSTGFIIPPKFRSYQSHFRFYYVEEPINFIRLEKGKQLVSILDLLFKSRNEGVKLPFDWLEYITTSSRNMALLVENYKDKLTQYLVFLGELQFVDDFFGHSLSAPFIQKIMKLIRNSNDEKLIIGGSRVLSDSNFFNIAKVENVLRMISLYPNNYTFSRIIDQQTLSHEFKPIEGKSQIIFNIVKKIHEYPDKYPFKIVCTASNILAGHYSGINLPPLLSDEEDLKIYISQSDQVQSERCS